MIIREANIKDADGFWEMQHDLDKETKFMLYEPGERKKNINIIEDLINKSVNGENLLLLAEEDMKIVGFISAQRGVPIRIKHTAYIVIGIRRAFQGQGIGSEFFRKLDSWAIEQNIKRLELTVMSPNEPAKHLYEKYGFFVEGVKQKAILLDGEFIDEFYMAKLLFKD
jgi:RimJ/RimL family protein N-acetyltransferase